jgi:hypothetical protein
LVIVTLLLGIAADAVLGRRQMRTDEARGYRTYMSDECSGMKSWFSLKEKNFVKYLLHPTQLTNPYEQKYRPLPAME